MSRFCCKIPLRRFAIVVDGNDDLAFLHPGQVLDRTGDTDRDVQPEGVGDKRE
jgi:hypothetical protein